jgi:hypothetical protein
MNIEILTDQGFSSFHGVRKTFSHDCVELFFDDNSSLIATKNHILFMNDHEVEVIDLIIGDIIDPGKKIIEIKEAKPQYVYDILETKNHKFIANGIISHNCQFMGSSATLISGGNLQLLEKSKPLNNDRHIFQYEQVKENHIYMIVVDVSRGKGLDHSAFSVIDITSIPYQQVLVYRNNLITPTDYADILERIAYAYNEAAILIELNDLGQQVSDCLYDNEYPNILSTQIKGRQGKKLTTSLVKKNDRGIRMTKPVKATGCATLKLLIEQNKLLIHDQNTISEFTTFSRDGNTYKAESGKHDDLVMGLVIFAWATVQPFFKNLYDSDILAALREKTAEEIDEEMLPLCIIDDGRDEYMEEAVEMPDFSW